MFERGYLYLNYMRGGPGFGDPLDRLQTLVEDDVNNFRVSPRYAEQVYGVVMVKNGDGSRHVDGGKAPAEPGGADQIRTDRPCGADPHLDGARAATGTAQRGNVPGAADVS